MKKIISILLIVVLVFAMTACKKSEPTAVAEIARAVQVEEIQLSENDNALLYIGTVDAKGVTNISSRISGKIDQINVKKGQFVEKGDVLFEMDTQDSHFQLSAAQAQMDAAQKNITKAQDSLKYNQNLFTQIKDLYTTGAVSKDQYDQTKLQLDVAVSTLEQVKKESE